MFRSAKTFQNKHSKWIEQFRNKQSEHKRIFSSKCLTWMSEQHRKKNATNIHSPYVFFFGIHIRPQLCSVSELATDVIRPSHFPTSVSPNPVESHRIPSKAPSNSTRSHATIIALFVYHLLCNDPNLSVRIENSQTFANGRVLRAPSTRFAQRALCGWPWERSSGGADGRWVPQ